MILTLYIHKLFSFINGVLISMGILYLSIKKILFSTFSKEPDIPVIESCIKLFNENIVVENSAMYKLANFSTFLY